VWDILCVNAQNAHIMRIMRINGLSICAYGTALPIWHKYLQQHVLDAGYSVAALHGQGDEFVLAAALNCHAAPWLYMLENV
jgi:hypothetical protein